MFRINHSIDLFFKFYQGFTIVSRHIYFFNETVSYGFRKIVTKAFKREIQAIRDDTEYVFCINKRKL